MEAAREATVFIVDDDASVRMSLSRLVRSAGLATECFSTAGEFIDARLRERAGCVLLDVRMPGQSGPQVHARMGELGIALPVIFLTGHGDVPTCAEAMKRGAFDFLLKPADEELLLRTVRAAIERDITARRRDRERHEHEVRASRLSPREREVMQLVIGGRLNKEIAFEMGISERTVKAHRGRVMEKMEADSVADLVRLCESAGIEPR